MTNMIQIKKLTKDYGENRGIFDIELEVKKGEVFGLVGINGSGKTTMIRHLMGFLHADAGTCFIQGKNCWNKAADLKREVAYIPGEISFPDIGSGNRFFELQAEYLHLPHSGKIKELTDRFALDPSANLKRMSKGMKQKTAIVNAFMSDADIFLLDEPTTGLDPLMQKVFTNLILEEKHKGKTIFMSSHMFDELEETCDRVAFLKNGRIIDVVKMSEIKGNERIKEYKIEFFQKEDYLKFIQKDFEIKRTQDEYNQVTIRISDDDLGELFQCLRKVNIKFITQIPQTLERYFNEKYNKSEEKK
ncbi:ABC transporter ATP-binding protein [Enterococcus sp. RIT-PI-f]|uniref:ABC transporter ATP-binding protein n=1 Tax=Enterococcus sp. RIT-PI-f TaxID=1690244 RepID=UPI0006CE0380|nr:ATP-binding cassette domain-containing protein [Enterococcus sp. RIT-PI-f]KPG70635.1 ABC transporter ATP-binding protein [Enterococcus sp. RIT-PI-f]